MSCPLTFYLADDDQRLATYRNVHEFWDGGRTLEDHLAWRSISPQHNRAHWYVGCLDGEVVVSLGSYPVQLRVENELLDGIMIGAVHTIPSQRGNGFAPSLLGWVEEQEKSRRATLSMLFTDIGTEYYARFGYRECPSWEVRVETARVQACWQLQQVDARENAKLLRRYYETSTDADTLALVRDEDYWDYVFRKQPEDITFLAEDESGEPAGYIRVRCRESAWTIQDWGLANQADENLTAITLAVAVQAEREGCPLLGGWMPRWPAGTQAIQFESRAGMNHTMVKSLDETRELSLPVLEAAQHLREIDHV